MSTIPPIQRQQFRIKYLIDNTDLSTLNIYVKESHGLFNVGKRKIAYSHNWIDENGEVVDLSTVKKEAREFTLDCFVKGETITEAISYIESLVAILDTPGIHTLTVNYYGEPTQRTYNVYRVDEIKVLKKFRYAKNIWTFNLNLKEYIA
jgi:hypothetical protein